VAHSREAMAFVWKPARPFRTAVLGTEIPRLLGDRALGMSVTPLVYRQPLRASARITGMAGRPDGSGEVHS